MTTTPIIGAPDWAGSQYSAWTVENKAKRMIEAMARRGIIADRDLSAPPGACADGACYLVAGSATGLWVGKEGQLAISVGTNAVSGWYFVVVAIEGVKLYIQDENTEITYNGAAWVETPTVSVISDLLDVDTTGVFDGAILRYDLSNGQWFVATGGVGDLLAANNLSDVADAQTAGGNIKPYESLIIAVGDETTAITTGTAKTTFRMPYAFTLGGPSGALGVRASLTTVSSSGIPTVDINESGSTILSTKLTIDASEKTSTTAVTPAVISDNALADDAEITIDIDVAGTGAAGLKVYLIGRRG